MSDPGDDRPTPSELEQLARSLSLDGSVGRRDALVIAEQLRRLGTVGSRIVVASNDLDPKRLADGVSGSD